MMSCSEFMSACPAGQRHGCDAQPAAGPAGWAAMGLASESEGWDGIARLAWG